MDTTLLVDGRRHVRLADYLTPQAAEAAERDANGWIKGLRFARVDGIPLRDRFTYRGDSLWWFAELYLHKQQTVARALRTIRAIDHLLERESSRVIVLEAADAITSLVLRGMSHRRVAVPTFKDRPSAAARLRIGARSRAYTVGAAASRLRPLAPPAITRAGIAAFVHAAFWRRDPAIPLLERDTYIGPVLRSLAGLLGEDSVHLVGLGPARNFRARRWWDPLLRRTKHVDDVTPIEAYAPWDALAGSVGVWMARNDVARALHGSSDLRQAAVIAGCDLWPLIAEDLLGVALLQFPWSSRAMDEAGAALDRLRPRAIVTYAEAGGWGRALMLEARRRQIPSAGVQHGFIYRHWLNYLHEPDEMTASERNHEDAGFPHPSLSLLYDEYAAEHLHRAARLPAASIRVTGSPSFDALAERVRACSPEQRVAIRATVGAGPGQQVVVVASKYSQIRRVLRPLVQAACSMPHVRLVLKPHPAETSTPYERAALGAANAVVADAASTLPHLLAVARAIVTVNSTVAIDAMVLGIPALVLAQPNNLTPFVEAGVMASATDGSVVAIGKALRAVTSDEATRERLARAAATFATRYGMHPDGHAAERAAAEIARLAAGSPA